MEEATPDLVKSYTVIVWAFAIICAGGALTLYGVSLDPATPEDLRSGIALPTMIMLFVSAVVGFVGYLRVGNSEYARPATTVLSWVLAFWLPVGTAIFLYWFFAVRSKESAD